METRNPTDAEIADYEELNRDAEDLRLALKEIEIDFQERYVITPETGVNPAGVFVTKEGHQIRKPVKGKAPAHLIHKCTRDDLTKMTKARIALQKHELSIEKFLAALRKECDAPHFAKMSTEYKWVTPDNPPRPIVIEDEPEEKEEEGDCGCEKVDEFSAPVNDDVEIEDDAPETEAATA